MINGVVFPIGGMPGGISHGLEWRDRDGTISYGIILKPVVDDEPVVVREMLTGQQLRYTEVMVHPGWALDDDSLVLFPDEIKVEQADVLRPIMVVPPGRYFAHMSLDRATCVRKLPLMSDDNSVLKAITEPVTDYSMREDIIALERFLQSMQGASTLYLLRNEARYQIVPESGIDLRYACVEMAMDYSKFLNIPHAKKAEWLGDRQLTYQYKFKDLGEIRDLWPNGLGNTWIIPEKPPDKRGAKRVRTQRNRGYIQIMDHQDEDGSMSNLMTYCCETKRARWLFAAAFIGEGLKWVSGATPPPPSPGTPKRFEYDFVTRDYVDRRQVHFTEARALAHVGRM